MEENLVEEFTKVIDIEFKKIAAKSISTADKIRELDEMANRIKKIVITYIDLVNGMCKGALEAVDLIEFD